MDTTQNYLKLLSVLLPRPELKKGDGVRILKVGFSNLPGKVERIIPPGIQKVQPNANFLVKVSCEGPSRRRESFILFRSEVQPVAQAA